MSKYPVLYAESEGRAPDYGGSYETMEQAQTALKEPVNQHYKIGTWDDYHAAYLKVPLCEITEREWWDALEVLPPMNWHHTRGVELFCICEMMSGPITNQYARLGDRHFTRYVDVTKHDTWINGEEILAYMETHKEKVVEPEQDNGMEM